MVYGPSAGVFLLLVLIGDAARLLVGRAALVSAHAGSDGVGHLERGCAASDGVVGSASGGPRVLLRKLFENHGDQHVHQQVLSEDDDKDEEGGAPSADDGGGGLHRVDPLARKEDEDGEHRPAVVTVRDGA